jgi:hypothetical protein
MNSLKKTLLIPTIILLTGILIDITAQVDSVEYKLSQLCNKVEQLTSVETSEVCSRKKSLITNHRYKFPEDGIYIFSLECNSPILGSHMFIIDKGKIEIVMLRDLHLVLKRIQSFFEQNTEIYSYKVKTRCYKRAGEITLANCVNDYLRH